VSVFPQSCWLSDNPNGGWLSTKFHLMGWALSAFSIQKHQSAPHLITNQQGADLLLGQLQLPYTNVSLALQTFQNPYPHCWVLKKLLAYSLQDEPFVHIDGDAFLFEPLPSHLLAAPLVAQNYEYNHPYYLNAFQEVQAFTYLPTYLKPEPNGRISGVNAGIIGGQNTQFFKDLYAQVLEFLAKNQKHLAQVNSEDFNVFLEQYFFKQYATHRQEAVGYLLPDEYGYPCHYQLDRFQDLPKHCPYLHLMNYKRNPTACEQMAQRLYLESPELHARCERVARQLEATQHPISLPEHLTFEGNYRNALLPANVPVAMREDITQYEQQKQEWIETLPPLAALRAHWQAHSQQTNAALSQPDEVLFQKTVQHHLFTKRLCSEWNWAEANELVGQEKASETVLNTTTEAAYYEVVLYVYLHQNIVKEQLLDTVGMLLLDTFEKPQPFGAGMEAVWQQIKSHQSNAHEAQTKQLLTSRLRFFLYQGALTFVPSF
jgi:hypothetical protein